MLSHIVDIFFTQTSTSKSILTNDSQYETFVSAISATRTEHQMEKLLILAALLFTSAIGIASAQTTSTGGAQQVMTETAGSGGSDECYCGSKGEQPVYHSSCCPKEKKKEDKPAEEKK